MSNKIKTYETVIAMFVEDEEEFKAIKGIIENVNKIRENEMIDETEDSKQEQEDKELLDKQEVLEKLKKLKWKFAGQNMLDDAFGVGEAMDIIKLL